MLAFYAIKHAGWVYTIAVTHYAPFVPAVTSGPPDNWCPEEAEEIEWICERIENDQAADVDDLLSAEELHKKISEKINART